MRTAELVKLLKKNGCRFLKHLANHDMYESPSGNKILVGRHGREEVATGTLNRILKDAGIK